MIAKHAFSLADVSSLVRGGLKNFENVKMRAIKGVN
jgi:hypothetical protein